MNSVSLNPEEGVTYFVPGLPDWVAEEDLQSNFEKYGEVIKAVLVKEKGTSNSRRFGYVTLADVNTRDAVCTDVHMFGDVSVRALLTKESLHSGDVKKIHLGRLPAHLTAEVIRDAFAQFGAVLDVHTPKDVRTGERKNFGFVTFSSEESFDAAIEAGALEIDGCEVEIKPSAQSKGEEVPSKKGKGFDDLGRSGGKGYEMEAWGKGAWGMYGCGKGWEEPADLIDPEGGILRDRKGGIKYFIPGLPDDVKDEDLRIHFRKYGEVLDAAVVTEKGTEASRGFGYVTMADASSRDDMLNEAHTLGGKAINILLTKDSLAGCDVKKVHLSKLREDISADAIRDVFAKFGQILDVHTPKDARSGERKNYGFVTFGSDEAFKAAIRAGSALVEDCRVIIKPAAQSREGDGDMGHPSEMMMYGGKGMGKGCDPWGWDMAAGKGWDGAFCKGWGGEWGPWGCDPWGKGCWGGPMGMDACYGKGYYVKGCYGDPWGCGWDPMWCGKGPMGKGPMCYGKGMEKGWSGKDGGCYGEGEEMWGGKGGKSDPRGGKGREDYESRGGKGRPAREDYDYEPRGGRGGRSDDYEPRGGKGRFDEGMSMAYGRADARGANGGDQPPRGKIGGLLRPNVRRSTDAYEESGSHRGREQGDRRDYGPARGDAGGRLGPYAGRR